jgi:hypothetical protein
MSSSKANSSPGVDSIPHGKHKIHKDDDQVTNDTQILGHGQLLKRRATAPLQHADTDRHKRQISAFCPSPLLPSLTPSMKKVRSAGVPTVMQANAEVAEPDLDKPMKMPRNTMQEPAKPIAMLKKSRSVCHGAGPQDLVR